MTKKLDKIIFNHALDIAMLCVMLFLGIASAKDKPKDEWQIRENLVTRLGGEWYKISRLTEELQTVQDIFQDLRDFELFPPELTRLNEETVLSFDKKIEKVGKKHQALVEQVEGLKAPLSDAMAILREMVIGQPVEDMFQVLDNDDVRRISAMFAIKHHIDSLWRDVDGLFTGLMPVVQMENQSGKETPRGFDNEFIEILKANLGQQAMGFYRTLNGIKDTLVKRGNEEQCARMFQVETHQIKAYLKTGNDRLAKTKLKAIMARYPQRRFTIECTMLFAKICFTRGEFDEALHVIDQLPDSCASSQEMLLYSAQSRYGLKKYADLWKWGSALDFKTLTGSGRNLALWLTMESGLALGKADRYSEFATLAIKDSLYALHVLHALGRYYVKNNDWNTAQSVFESALRSSPTEKIDKQAYRRISLALAQSYYERKNYDKALRLFFDLLNQEGDFAEALFGISWCYIALEDYPKAETSLRKLINQDPGSPLAVEGLLVTMQRYVTQAKNDWEKLTYLTNEERRLVQKQELINVKKSADTTRRRAEEYVKLSSKIEELIGTLRNEKKPSYEDIAGYYDKAGHLARLVADYYETGTFQEVLFSEKREKLLRRLDSLVLLTKETTARRSQLSYFWNGAARIKNLVWKTSVFAVETLIDRFRWEREYVDWQKTAIKNAKESLMRKISASSDSGFLAEIDLQQKRLNIRMDSLVKTGDELNKKWYGILTKKCTEVLDGPLDSADGAYIRYHLGELSYGNENDNYAMAYGAYETKLAVYDSLGALYHAGKLALPPERPVEPILNHKASIEQYQTVLQNYPRSSLEHAVRYSLAWCYNDQGMFERAVAQMDSLATGYPASQYAPQALLYIGEYMFDHGKLDNALKAYQSVIKYPESEWFDKALYKLAWTQYRLSNPEKAISSFLALVDLGQGSPSGKSLLEKESIDYIAISFSETDVTGEKGLERATNFVTRFGDQAKGAQILQRMASIFKEQGRFDMAQKTYRTLLRIYPEYKNSPVIESELLAVFEKSCSVEEANIGRIEFFNKYNKNGDWARVQNDPQIRQRGDSISCKLLYDASLSYHQLALQKNDSSAYSAAMENYENFINSYPLSPHASECHYNLAEIRFSLGDYQQAAEDYIAVSMRYPDSKYRETAAWNAIVASQNLLKKENGTSR
jgi:tetratricopeptide (TPR) repeat protein